MSLGAHWPLLRSRMSEAREGHSTLLGASRPRLPQPTAPIYLCCVSLSSKLWYMKGRRVWVSHSLPSLVSPLDPLMMMMVLVSSDTCNWNYCCLSYCLPLSGIIHTRQETHFSVCVVETQSVHVLESWWISLCVNLCSLHFFLSAIHANL